LTYDEEINYCKNCGMPLEKGRTYCVGCGSKIPTIIDKEKKEVPSEKKDTTEHIKETLSEMANGISTTVEKTSTHSTFAIILAVFGCFTGCFILPIFGLKLVKKAEKKNEDPKLVKIARILNSVLIAISIIVLIGIVLAIVLPITI
jgi:uncharacterized Zn finger protein (UPF0148 family)